MPDHLADLDCEQRAAVRATERAIAVLAGPGSGKTRTLSHRALYLLLEDPGSKVRLLTFTNKAAAEMKARALSLAGAASSRIKSSTFHTFGLELLRAHAKEAGIDQAFEVLDREDQIVLANKAGGSESDLNRWSYLRLRRRPARGALLAFGERYQHEKKQSSVLDFDDLIVFSAELFHGNAALAAAYAQNHRHLLVDEFQDTNTAQFAIVRALFPHLRTIGVCADDDQAIFEWAGAEARNVRRFMTDLSAKECPLTVNYRSRSEIVRVANKLIASDPTSSGRQMRPSKEGGEVRLLVFKNLLEESYEVAREIKNLIDHGEAPNAIAILTRATFRAERMLEALREFDLPVSNWLGQRYDARARRLLTTCLSVVRAKLNDRNARRLCELAGVEDTGIRETAKLFAAYGDLPSIRSLRTLQETAWAGGKPSGLVELALECVRDRDRELENEFAQILDEVRAFERHDPELSVEHLLTEFVLGGTTGAPTEGGGIRVATLHRTKGLQWPRVYMLGLEDGHMPGQRNRDQESIGEERRLCFVGVCRAEDSLTLTRVERYDGWTSKEPSPFLNGMGLTGA